MTKNQKSDPFGFGFNSKNPFGIKGFSSKNPLGIKIPKSILPKTDNTLGKIMRESQKQQERSWKEMKRGFNVGIPTIKTPRTQAIHYKPVYIPAYRKIRNYNSSFGTSNPSFMLSLMDTVNDIITMIHKKREEKEKRERLMEAKMKESFRNALKLQEISTFVTSQTDTRHRILEKQMSDINAKIEDNTEKIEQVSNGLDLIREKLESLEDYKKTLEVGIAKLIEVNSTDVTVVSTLNNLLEDKKRTEDEIQKIRSTLAKVVGQQEKDVPFNQSLRKLLDDKRFDNQVL